MVLNLHLSTPVGRVGLMHSDLWSPWGSLARARQSNSHVQEEQPRCILRTNPSLAHTSAAYWTDRLLTRAARTSGCTCSPVQSGLVGLRPSGPSGPSGPGGGGGGSGPLGPLGAEGRSRAELSWWVGDAAARLGPGRPTRPCRRQGGGSLWQPGAGIEPTVPTPPPRAAPVRVPPGPALQQSAAGTGRAAPQSVLR